MTQQPCTLTEINARLAKANSDCETWRAARSSEKYLEACSTVEVLELQRTKIVSDGLKEVRNDMIDEDAELSRMGISSNRAKLMSALSIAYDGCRYYYYGLYRYDKLESAVEYAKLQRARIGAPRKIPTPTPELCKQPSDSDRELMNTAGVAFANGVYHFGEYRYDGLADALAYAHR